MNLKLSLVVCLFVVGACRKEAAPPPPAAPAAAPAPAPVAPAPAPAGSVAQVHVTNQGAISLNGQTVSLDQLKAALASTTSRPTSIEYHRENPESDPAPEAASVVHGVLTALMDSKIPVKLKK